MTAILTCLLAGLETISCPGEYGGHLQGLAVGPDLSIYWSFTVELVKTDATGKILASVNVPTHHGDLTYGGDLRILLKTEDNFSAPIRYELDYSTGIAPWKDNTYLQGETRRIQGKLLYTGNANITDLETMTKMQPALPNTAQQGK